VLEQRVRLDRLADVGEGPPPHRLDREVHGRMRRDDQRRDAGLGLLEGRHHVEPRPVGEAPVEHRHVEGLRREERLRGLEAVGFPDPMPGRPQVHGHGPPDQRVVFHGRLPITVTRRYTFDRRPPIPPNKWGPFRTDPGRNRPHPAATPETTGLAFDRRRAGQGTGLA
jgi:hypothetical protein